MTEKKCKACSRVKPLSEYYKAKNMKDGHHNKCKECYKADVLRNRRENIDYYREYDRKRGNRQPPGYLKKYREKYPNKYKAHNMVNNAIRDGKLHKEPCSECGSNNRVEGHHDDYLKPLNIRWLCTVCHNAWHSENGEGKNAT